VSLLTFAGLAQGANCNSRSRPRWSAALNRRVVLLAVATVVAGWEVRPRPLAGTAARAAPTRAV